MQRATIPSVQRRESTPTRVPTSRTKKGSPSPEGSRKEKRKWSTGCFGCWGKKKKGGTCHVLKKGKEREKTVQLSNKHSDSVKKKKKGKKTQAEGMKGKVSPQEKEKKKRPIPHLY